MDVIAIRDSLGRGGRGFASSPDRKQCQHSCNRGFFFRCQHSLSRQLIFISTPQNDVWLSIGTRVQIHLDQTWFVSKLDRLQGDQQMHVPRDPTFPISAFKRCFKISLGKIGLDGWFFCAFALLTWGDVEFIDPFQISFLTLRISLQAKPHVQN